jgi:HTH-type transcriptional regulator/antitoxin HigA
VNHPKPLKRSAPDTYLELILAFPLMSIRSEAQLTEAQGVLDRLLARGCTDAGEEMYLDALSDLVATFEDEHHPIHPASDAEKLRHFMEAQGVSQTDSSRDARIPNTRLSEVLAGKKPFSRQIIRKLALYFNVEPSLLAANCS